jgi:TM2 domain-containing membrane protein YozV
MALTTCPECSSNVSDKAKSCPSCGFPFEKSTEESTDANEPAEPSGPQVVTIQKSRFVFIVLGLFLGGLGIHNFYVGFNIQASIQFVLGVITILMPWMTGIPVITAAVLVIWLFVDLVGTTHDVNNVRLV